MALQTIDNQACVAHSAKDVRVETQQLSFDPTTQVLIRVARGGICGSDLHYYQHGRAGMSILKHPLVLGHEFVGVVEQVPPLSGLDLHVGQRVAINPSQPCNACKLCLQGKRNLCRQMKFMGSAQFDPHVDGGFRDRVAVAPHQCIAYAAAARDEVMVFAEPLAVALHAVAQAGELLGKRVLVTGSGPIGCLVMAVARRAGASEVIGTDVSERCRELAQAMGADRVVDPLDQDAVAPWEADGGYFDVTFEASGAPAAIASTVHFTAPKGRIVQLGMGAARVELPLGALLVKEIELVGSFRFVDEFTTAVRWLESGRLDPLPLLSAQFPAQDITAALELASDKAKAAKVQLVLG